MHIECFGLHESHIVTVRRMTKDGSILPCPVQSINRTIEQATLMLCLIRANFGWSVQASRGVMSQFHQGKYFLVYLCGVGNCSEEGYWRFVRDGEKFKPNFVHEMVLRQFNIISTEIMVNGRFLIKVGILEIKVGFFTSSSCLTLLTIPWFLTHDRDSNEKAFYTRRGSYLRRVRDGGVRGRCGWSWTGEGIAP